MESKVSCTIWIIRLEITVFVARVGCVRTVLSLTDIVVVATSLRTEVRGASRWDLRNTYILELLGHSGEIHDIFLPFTRETATKMLCSATMIKNWWNLFWLSKTETITYNVQLLSSKACGWRSEEPTKSVQHFHGTIESFPRYERVPD